jgi:hypothetical protein
MSAYEKIVAQRSNSLAVLIAETKRRMSWQGNTLHTNFFREQPDTVEAYEFLSGYLVEEEVPVVPASLKSTPEESAPENSTLEEADVDNVQIVETEEDNDYEDDGDDVGEHFISRGLFSEHVGCDGKPPSLPCTEMLAAALQRTITLNASKTVR